MYTFWKNLMALHGLPSNYITTLAADRAVYQTQMNTYNVWVDAQQDSGDPLYGTTRPAVPKVGAPKTMTLEFKTTDPTLSVYDTRITFSFIDETFGTGLGRPEAKVGDVWTAKGDPIEWQSYSGVKGTASFGTSAGPSKVRSKANSMGEMRLYWQTGLTTFKYLRIYGAVHENFIYGGKSVRITSSEALDDADDSGFLIPLHYPSVKEAGLVSSTQLATANTYLVFNSYEVFKKKWYETFLGILFIIIVVVVAAAIIAPGAVGGISGIFGTNAAVGAGLGLSGTASIVAGAVANAIAAVLLSTALSYGSTALFGEKWGALIGSLLSFAISFGMSGGFSNLSTLFQPKNLLALSSALANGYKGFVQANITEMNVELVKIGEETNKELKKIQNQMDELMGNALAFDQMSLTDTDKGNGSGTGGYLPESLDEFIQRTSLTGSDIVDMTLSIVSDFTALSLTLPKT
jgi:hypothetical protein